MIRAAHKLMDKKFQLYGPASWIRIQLLMKHVRGK